MNGSGVPEGTRRSRDDADPHRQIAGGGARCPIPLRRNDAQELALDPELTKVGIDNVRAGRSGRDLKAHAPRRLAAFDAAVQNAHGEPAHDGARSAPAPRTPREHPPVRDGAADGDARRHVVAAKREPDPLALDRAPRADDARARRIVKRAHRGETRAREPRADPRTCAGQILEIEVRVDRRQVGHTPHHRRARLVRLRGGLREPGARRDADRDRHALGERIGDGALDALDERRRIVAWRKARGELIDRVHRRDGEDATDGRDHAVMHPHVALDALRANGEAGAAKACVSQPINCQTYGNASPRSGSIVRRARAHPHRSWQRHRRCTTSTWYLRRHFWWFQRSAPKGESTFPSDG